MARGLLQELYLSNHYGLLARKEGDVFYRGVFHDTQD